MNEHPNLMRLLAAAFLCFLVVVPTRAQITGRVSDAETGAPLAGSSVLIAESNQGTSTSLTGRFQLPIQTATEVTLLVSHVGYSPQTRIVQTSDGVASVDILLQPASLSLDELVVERASMTGGLLSIQGASGSSHLVSARALERFAQTDVHRALRAVPGVSIQEEDGYGLRPNIGLRGTGTERSSKITVMEDGILIAPAPYAASAAYYFPTTGRMSGIEVVKGSSQIRFGPYTTGGAINLLSTPIPEGRAGQLKALAGSESNRLLHATLGDNQGRFAYLLETHQQESDGFKQLDSGDNTGFDKRDYLAKVRLSSRPDARIPQSLTLKASMTNEVSDETYLGLTSSDFGLNPFRRYAASQEDRMDADQWQAFARHRMSPVANLAIVTTAYTTQFARNWYKLDKVNAGSGNVKIGSLLSSPESHPAAYALVAGQASGTLSVKANNREYLSRGLQMDVAFDRGFAKVEGGTRVHYDEMDRFQWVDTYQMDAGSMALENAGIPGTESNRIESASAVATYLQAELSINRFTIRPGLRYENVVQKREDFGKADPDREGVDLSTRRNVSSALLPGLGVSYALESYWTAFAGVHKGFAPPGTTQGSNPESSVNYEIGTRYWRGPVGLEVVGFISDYANLLGSDLAASGGTGSTDQFNGGAALVRGLELSGSVNAGALVAWRASIPVTVAYTLTDGSFSTDFHSEFDPWGQVESGDALPYMARNQLNTTVGVETGRWDLAVTGFWSGYMRTKAGSGQPADHERIDGHLTLDMSVNAQITADVSIFGVVRNVTDQIYVAARRPAGLRPGLPRSFMIGLRTRF